MVATVCFNDTVEQKLYRLILTEHCFVIKSHLYSLQSWSSPPSHILTHSAFNFMLDIAAEIVIGRCIKGALHRFYTWSYAGSSWGILYSLCKQSNHVLCGFWKLINEGWKCLNTELYQFVVVVFFLGQIFDLQTWLQIDHFISVSFCPSCDPTEIDEEKNATKEKK